MKHFFSKRIFPFATPLSLLVLLFLSFINAMPASNSTIDDVDEEKFNLMILFRSLISILPTFMQGYVPWLVSFFFLSKKPLEEEIYNLCFFVCHMKSMAAMNSLTLIMKNHSLNFVNLESGMTPLSMAICVGNEQLTKCLLDAGADPNFPCILRDLSPLELAILFDKEEIAKLLLKAPSLDLQTPNPHTGFLPLTFSLSNLTGNLVIAELILDQLCEAVLNESDHYLRNAIAFASIDGLKLLLDRTIKYDSLESLQDTIMHFTIRQNNTEMADLLVSEYGFNVSIGVFFSLETTDNIWQVINAETRQWLINVLALQYDERLSDNYNASSLDPLECIFCFDKVGEEDCKILQKSQLRVHDECMVDFHSRDNIGSLVLDTFREAMHYADSRVEIINFGDEGISLDPEEVFQDNFMSALGL